MCSYSVANEISPWICFPGPEPFFSFSNGYLSSHSIAASLFVQIWLLFYSSFRLHLCLVLLVIEPAYFWGFLIPILCHLHKNIIWNYCKFFKFSLLVYYYYYFSLTRYSTITVYSVLLEWDDSFSFVEYIPFKNA